METDDAMHAYYAARAPYYDEVYARPERRADLAFLQEHLRGAFAGRNVLEVACGTGYWTQCIAPIALHVVATDLLHEPLRYARERSQCATVQFEQADAYALPERLGTFDAAFAGLWLSHVPLAKRRPFVASLRARLQPGARVILIDNSDVQCATWPIVDHDADGNTYQQRTLKDGSVRRVLKNFPKNADLVAMTADCAASSQYRSLENFWLYEYVVR